MDTWPVNQRSFCARAYHRSESVIEVQRQFRREYNIPRRGRIPSRNTILRWVTNFRDHGSVKNEFVGSVKTVRTPENVERVRQAVIRSPVRSARRQALALNITRRSLGRILHEDLRFHPYKIQVVHKILPQDLPARIQFCRTFLDVLNPNVLNLIMSDEAHFHLSGYVNKQNFRYWAAEQPQQIHEQPLHSEKVTVWCGVSAFGILGPYFFEENDRAVTVTSQRYLEMLQNFLLAELQQLGVENNVLWFQQDGATSHTARICMAALRNMFPGRLISRHGDFNWPPRSPDLTSPDFFLWGYLKARVFENRPQTLQALKDNITREIRAINQEMLLRVTENFQSRLQECLEQRGGHLKDIIFKK